MPAWKEEIEEAIEEGVEIRFLTAPVRMITKNEKIEKLECVKMKLGDLDSSGRRKPVQIENSEFLLDIDTLVPAISQGPLIGGLASDNSLKLTKWNTIEVDQDTLYTGADGVFAGGDVVLGPKTVTEAMSHGKIAAEMIDKYIKGEELTRKYDVTIPAAEVGIVEMSDEDIEQLKRFKAPMLEILKEKIILMRLN